MLIRQAQDQIDGQVFELYDEYCHGHIDRREFFRQAGKLAIAGAVAVAMAEALLANHAEAHEVLFTDERIKAKWADYSSPGGTSEEMRGYPVALVGEGSLPAVLVMHENRAQNPYVQDVARRFAVSGFLALALATACLPPIGGYPGNDDNGRVMQRSLDQAKLRKDRLNSAPHVKAHALSNGKLGATGFCWGGVPRISLPPRWVKNCRRERPFTVVPRTLKKSRRARQHCRYTMHKRTHG